MPFGQVDGHQGLNRHQKEKEIPGEVHYGEPAQAGLSVREDGSPDGQRNDRDGDKQESGGHERPCAVSHGAATGLGREVGKTPRDIVTTLRNAVVPGVGGGCASFFDHRDTPIDGTDQRTEITAHALRFINPGYAIRLV